MECTECKLGTGFTDGLSCDYTYGFAFLNQTVVGKVSTVAFRAYAFLAFASEDRADFNGFDGRCVDAVGSGIVDFLSGGNYDFTADGVDDVVYGYASEDAFTERSHNFVVVLDFGAYESAECAAVLFVDNHVVSHVDETACEVTGVGCFQGGVGKTLTGTVCGDEVFQY